MRRSSDTAGTCEHMADDLLQLSSLCFQAHTMHQCVPASEPPYKLWSPYYNISNIMHFFMSKQSLSEVSRFSVQLHFLALLAGYCSFSCDKSNREQLFGGSITGNCKVEKVSLNHSIVAELLQLFTTAKTHFLKSSVRFE